MHNHNLSYQIQANQWAMRANVAMSRRRTAAPYSEYLSILRATRTNRRRRAVFNKPIKVVVCADEKWITDLFFVKVSQIYRTNDILDKSCVRIKAFLSGYNNILEIHIYQKTPRVVPHQRGYTVTCMKERDNRTYAEIWISHHCRINKGEKYREMYPCNDRVFKSRFKSRL